MPEGNPNLYEVLTKVTKSGQMARTNLFSMTFQGGVPVIQNLSKDLVIRGKGTQLPASDLGVIEVPYRGRKLKVPGQRSFAEWTVTIMETEGMEIRTAIEYWMNILDASSTGDRQPDAICDIIVSNLSIRDQTPLMTYYLYGAFPTSIGAVEMSFDEQTSPMEYQVTFQYSFHDAYKAG